MIHHTEPASPAVQCHLQSLRDYSSPTDTTLKVYFRDKDGTLIFYRISNSCTKNASSHLKEVLQYRPFLGEGTAVVAFRQAGTHFFQITIFKFDTAR